MAREPEVPMQVAGWYDGWQHSGHVALHLQNNQRTTAQLQSRCLGPEFLMSGAVAQGPLKSVSDVGCATGDFYRFFRHISPETDYKGFDISLPALAQARLYYPEASFHHLLGPNWEQNIPAHMESDLVFSRDVAVHQTDPVSFLKALWSVTKKHLIVRLPTRDEGATVFDPELSYQEYCDSRIPWIVLNKGFLAELIMSFRPRPRVINMVSAYEDFAQHPVNIPEELKGNEGTAHTALLVSKPEE